MKIKRVFNNNVVLAYKDNDEAVIFGKGVGFQKKHGDIVEDSKIEKIFTTNEKQSSNLETLFNEVSTEYVDLTYKIVKQAESDLGIEFNSSIYITVMDHINYALIRAKEGLFIKNALIWEIQRTYSKEYQCALKTLEIIYKDTGIELPQDEAGTLAIHYFNAQDPLQQMNDSIKMVGIIQDIIKLIQKQFDIEFDEEEINYNRMMTHLRYFVNNLLKNEKKEIKARKMDDDFLYQSIKKQYPDVYLCVQNIKRYVNLKLNKQISDEEKMYLMIHIQRIIEKKKDEVEK